MRYNIVTIAPSCARTRDRLHNTFIASGGQEVIPPTNLFRRKATKREINVQQNDLVRPCHNETFPLRVWVRVKKVRVRLECKHKNCWGKGPLFGKGKVPLGAEYCEEMQILVFRGGFISRFVARKEDNQLGLVLLSSHMFASIILL